MKTIKRTFAALGGLLITATLLVGCNTMSGLGQDLSAGGHALTQSAQQDQSNMSSQPNTKTPAATRSPSN